MNVHAAVRQSARDIRLAITPEFLVLWLRAARIRMPKHKYSVQKRLFPGIFHSSEILASAIRERGHR